MARVDVRFRSVLALALALLCSACGGGFDPASEVKTLRVLGVQKDKPYPQPDDSVNLRLLYHDPLESSASQASVFWLPECTNPPGDLYYGCFPQIGASLAGSALPTGPIKLDLPSGTSHSFQVGSDAELFGGRPAPDRGQPLYALVYSFFAVCAGDLHFELPVQEGALPLACRDSAGTLLGPDRFVVGYVSLYIFRKDSDPSVMPVANANPVIDGFEISGTAIETSCSAGTPCGGCIDEECLDPVQLSPKVLQEADCSEPENPRCVAACADDGDEECPGIPIRPLLEESLNVEPDEISRTYYQRDVGEQLWIDYYVDRGGVKSDVRLLNDAMTGWNPKFGTEFYAPKEAGPVNVWAVVHDNRGGASWVAVRLEVQ